MKSYQPLNCDLHDYLEIACQVLGLLRSPAGASSLATGELPAVPF